MLLVGSISLFLRTFHMIWVKRLKEFHYSTFMELIFKVEEARVCFQTMWSLSDVMVLHVYDEWIGTFSSSEILRNEWESVWLKARRGMQIFIQQNEWKIWIYRFKSKIISMPWTVTKKHVISCCTSGSVLEQIMM